MKKDFNLLEEELVKYSKFVIFKENGNSNICKKAILKLQNLRASGDERKKYITIFVVFNNKVIDRFDYRLDKFKLNIFSSYDTKDAKIKFIAYYFDTDKKIDKSSYKSFITYLDKDDIKYSIYTKYNSIKKAILPLTSIFTGLILLFCYFGLSEYGIPIDLISNMAVITFLLTVSVFAIPIVTGVLIIVYFLLILPILFGIYFNVSIPTIAFFIIGYIFIVFILYINNIYPNIVKISKVFLSEVSTVFITFLTFIMVSFFTLGILITIYYTIMKDLKNNPAPYMSKYVVYEWVISYYYRYYSGYPKIVYKNKKMYYLVANDDIFFYTYDIDDVKSRYFKLLKKKENKYTLKEICKNSNTRETFKKNYIINNPYIKPNYINKYISTSDKNITIESFDKSKMIDIDDINNKLCKK